MAEKNLSPPHGKKPTPPSPSGMEPTAHLAPSPNVSPSNIHKIHKRKEGKTTKQAGRGRKNPTASSQNKAKKQ
jgi:hypothetical protein